MSQGSTAQGEKGVATSAAEPTMPAATTGTCRGSGGQIVVGPLGRSLFTGRKATEDYQPSSSEGERTRLWSGK